MHIIVSVSLLGDSAGYLAVAIHGANISNPLTARASYETLQMLAFVFGIPLSFAALLSGLWLTFLTKWRLFRYSWVTIKFLLIISVIMVGGLVLKSGMDAMLHGTGGTEKQLIVGSAYDVIALTVATTLGVFKPRKKWPKASNKTTIKSNQDEDSHLYLQRDHHA